MKTFAKVKFGALFVDSQNGTTYAINGGADMIEERPALALPYRVVANYITSMSILRY